MTGDARTHTAPEPDTTTEAAVAGSDASTPTTHIRRAFDRSARALEVRPNMGHHTARSKVTVLDGARCEIEEGRWKLVSDLSEKAGGTGAGPDPGVFGRAAFGSCLAMAYVMWAAQRDIKLDRLEVEVEADFDAGAQYGTSQAPAGYTQVRYHVTVESNASQDEITRLLDEAETHCPYLDVFGRAQDLQRSVAVTRPVGA